MRITLLAGLALVMALALSPVSHGQTTITFTTPANSSTVYGSEDASATFVFSKDKVVVTLKNLLQSPTNVGQVLTDLDFVLSGLTGISILSSSSGQQIFINSNGTSQLGKTGTTGWALGSYLNELILCTVCAPGHGWNWGKGGRPSGPAEGIIGPGPYKNSNSTIRGNRSNNPFLNQSATFTIFNSSITSSTSVSDVIFSFGTVYAIANVQGFPSVSPTPEPRSLLLFGSGLFLIGAVLRRRLVRTPPS
jgi:hypothetical protein